MADNRLIHESSPYLLQHAHNPVNWHPWGAEAFAAAREQNKPIFLSIGYATCHWCHVMAHESFEDQEAADTLNRDYIAIKVDREERPDIDAVYMAACQLATGSGGWPLSIFMTPDKRPFFAGTYLPKTSRFGRMGLIELCRQIVMLWHGERKKIDDSAAEIVRLLDRYFSFEAERSGGPDAGLLDRSAAQTAQAYDQEHGGFEKAPKFPMPHRLTFLMHAHERRPNPQYLSMVRHTLTAMRLGGIWDHVGFGLHRYSTDRQWLLPHFEKMLYDQALSAMAYLQAFELTGDPLLKQTAQEIFTYVLRDMTDESGGFYTAQDADSEGEEGRFYVWQLEPFQRFAETFGPDIRWTDIFNLKPDGNFLEEAGRRTTGANILHLTRPLTEWAAELNIAPAQLNAQWDALRRRLFAERLRRVPPLKDDKILTDWNGLMIAALATGARVLDETRYLHAAQRAADFILTRLMDHQGRLLHRYRLGQTGLPATANDYAFLIRGLLELACSGSGDRRLCQAIDLQERMIDLFWDRPQGGFFLTAADPPELPVRPKELYDGALPSANSMALENLVLLARRTGDSRWSKLAMELVQAFGCSVRGNPLGYVHTLNGWHQMLKA